MSRSITNLFNNGEPPTKTTKTTETKKQTASLKTVCKWMTEINIELDHELGENDMQSCTSTPSNKTEVFNVFVQFHGFIYLDQDFSEARKLKDKVIEGFKLLLQQGVLKQDDMIRVSAITLFTLYHIKSGRGVDDLEEFDCISKAEEESWQLCLEYAVNLFDAMVTHVNDQSEGTRCPALVYIGVFCQWIASNSSSVWKEDTIKAVPIWEKFATLLNHLSSTIGHPLDKSDIPLCEDWELHCFLPLHSFQKKLNFAIKKSKVDNEDTHRRSRLLHFGSQLSNHSPRILSKVDDIVTGLAKFSLRTDTNATDNCPQVRGPQERPLKLLREFVREAPTGQQLSSLPTLAFIPKRSPSPTPFTETSSLFNNSSHGAVGGPVGPVERPSFLATPQVAQYSLFQSGWKAPLTTAFGATGSSHSSPIERPPPHELSPIGHTYSNQGTLLGSPGEYHPPVSGIPPFQGPPRSQGYSTPSPGPLDGFGLSENWGSGVWGPAKTSTVAASTIPAPTQQVQSMWNQDMSPGQGMSPLQQLLHDQQKRKDHNGT